MTDLRDAILKLARAVTMLNTARVNSDPKVERLAEEASKIAVDHGGYEVNS